MSIREFSEDEAGVHAARATRHRNMRDADNSYSKQPQSIKVNIAFNKEIIVSESGDRVEKPRIHEVKREVF